MTNATKPSSQYSSEGVYLRETQNKLRDLKKFTDLDETASQEVQRMTNAGSDDVLSNEHLRAFANPSNENVTKLDPDKVAGEADKNFFKTINLLTEAQKLARTVIENLNQMGRTVLDKVDHVSGSITDTAEVTRLETLEGDLKRVLHTKLAS